MNPATDVDDISDSDEDSDEREIIPDAEITKIESFSQVAGPKSRPNYIKSEWEDPTSTSRQLSDATWIT